MKLKIRISLAATALLFGVAGATYAQAASASVGASVTLVTPISIVKNADLDLGSGTVSSSAGTLTMSPSGTRTATGGVALLPSNPGTAASFTVTGAPSATYSITTPSTVTLAGPSSATLTLDQLTTSIGTTGALNVSGNQTFTLGGRANVAANQAVGQYTATFQVTTSYN